MIVDLVQLEVEYLPEVLLDVLLSEEDLGLRECLTNAAIRDELV